MKTLLTLFVLLFSLFLFSCERGPYIEDYKIEGIALGDSLLDYLSAEEIKNEINKNRYMYDYLSEDFGEVYLFNKNFETYDYISFFVKPNDEKFVIHLIRGFIAYNEDTEGCKKKQIEIVENFSNTYTKTIKRENSLYFPFDPSEKSTLYEVEFTFDSGDAILVTCSNFEENLRNKNNWDEGLSVGIQRKEFDEWWGTELK